MESQPDIWPVFDPKSTPGPGFKGLNPRNPGPLSLKISRF